MKNSDNNEIFKGEIFFYQSEAGQIKVNVRLENDTCWMTQAGISELFQVKPQNITMHLKNIYAENELQKATTCKDFLQVQNEGARQVQRNRKYYNLDVIISVGYRVNSKVATRFRIWATERLKEYIVKGFTIDDERLKGSNNNRYFGELLARIRDIRSSEKVFWRKVLDIYSTSIDYDPKAGLSTQFFKQLDMFLNMTGFEADRGIKEEG